MTKGEASDMIDHVTTPRQRALLDYLGIKGMIGESNTKVRRGFLMPPS